MSIKTIVVGSLDTNCYILYKKDNQFCVVVDPGDEFEKIKNCLDNIGKKPTHILLTHGHFDHVLAIPELRQFFPGIKVVCHKDDVVLLGDVLNGSTVFESNKVVLTPDIVLSGLGNSWYKVGEGVEGFPLDVMYVHTPGHTEGGVCFLFEGILLSGDTLFRQGVGRTDLPSGDHTKLVSSLQNIVFKLPPETVVFSGHGDSTTIGLEKTH